VNVLHQSGSHLEQIVQDRQRPGAGRQVFSWRESGVLSLPLRKRVLYPWESFLEEGGRL
jgi:hypothetical protein